MMSPNCREHLDDAKHEQEQATNDVQKILRIHNSNATPGVTPCINFRTEFSEFGVCDKRFHAIPLGFVHVEFRRQQVEIVEDRPGQPCS